MLRSLVGSEMCIRDSTRTIYQETIVSFPFEAVTGTRTVGLPAPVATTLVATMDTTLSANIDLSNSLFTDPELSQIVLNSASNAALNVGQRQGQTVAAVIANSENYFDAWYVNRALAEITPGQFAGTSPSFLFLQGDIVQWDNRRVLFSSGNEDNNFRVQHTIFNWESVGGGTFAMSRTGAAEVLPLVSGQAPIATVIAAVDASNASSSIEDIKNFNGRLAQNPLLTEPAGGFATTGRYGNNITRTDT